MARLDRLAPVKEVAQIGAAIGREFSHELLARGGAAGRANCRPRCDELVGAELVFRRGDAARGDLQLQARAGAGRGLRRAC